LNERKVSTHIDSDGISNGEEGESDQEYQLLMAFVDKCTEVCDDFLIDSLEEKDNIIEEIHHPEIRLEEAKLAEDALKKQILERERHNEKLELETKSLRKEFEKTKGLNLIFAKGSEILEEIITVQHTPLIKIGLEYNGES